MGIMRAILGSHQRPADGCANLFQTNLSLICRLPATVSSLGIKDKNKEAHASWLFFFIGHKGFEQIIEEQFALFRDLPVLIIFTEIAFTERPI